MLSKKDMIDRMKYGWRGGLAGGTVCGQGSIRENTWRVAEWLPKIVQLYDIKSVCDAGAGDLTWIRNVDWDVDYTPYDLIPRAPSVKKLDITTQKMKASDAILCRMVLNHLGNGDDYTRVTMALDLFKQTSRYLIATHFIDGGPQREKQFMRLDLTQWLGEPIQLCFDGHEDNCRLGIWDLQHDIDQ